MYHVSSDRLARVNVFMTSGCLFSSEVQKLQLSMQSDNKTLVGVQKKKYQKKRFVIT